MPTYKQADGESAELLRQVIDRYHPHLDAVGVRIGLLMAHAPVDKYTGEPKGPALKLHGDVALAIIKPNSLKDRVEGKPDVTITCDGDRWPELSGEKRISLLDHELEHLVLVEDEEGAVMLDDCNRPKVKTRPHDFLVAGFYSVVDRHKTEAHEAQQYIELHREMSQRTFPWG